MQLRDYQKQMIDDIKKAFLVGNKSVLGVAPTAAGKTVIFSQIIADAIAQNLTCMVVVHRASTLIGQTVDKLKRLGINPSLICAGSAVELDHPVYIASLQTLSNRDIPSVDLVIFDEAHTTSFYKVSDRIFNELPNAKFLGFTATPWRLSNAESLGDIYQMMVTSPGYGDMIRDGYLVRPRHFAYKGSDRINLSNATKVCGEYQQKALDVLCNSPRMIQRTVDELKTHGGDRQTICFAVSINHATALVDAFRLNGFTAESITGETPEQERIGIFERFEGRKNQILVNVNVLTEGYDSPIASCVLMTRPTLSKSLYVQMVGRGLRPLEGKEDCIIIDIADNYARHGLVSGINSWAFEDAIADEESRCKCCPDCGSVMNLRDPECPSCGYGFSTESAEYSQHGQEVDLPIEEVLNPLVTKQNRRKQQWDRKKQAAKRLVKKGMGLKPAAKSIGVNPLTVRRWAKAEGWERGYERNLEGKKKEVCKLMKQGMSMNAISKNLGLSTATVSSWAESEGWVNEWAEKWGCKKQEAQRLMQEGMDPRAIANSIGVNAYTIKRWAKKEGWQTVDRPSNSNQTTA